MMLLRPSKRELTRYWSAQPPALDNELTGYVLSFLIAELPSTDKMPVRACGIISLRGAELSTSLPKRVATISLLRSHVAVSEVHTYVHNCRDIPLTVKYVRSDGNVSSSDMFMFYGRLLSVFTKENETLANITAHNNPTAVDDHLGWMP